MNKSGVSREELFVVTKLWNDQHGKENVLAACKESLKKYEKVFLKKKLRLVKMQTKRKLVI